MFDVSCAAQERYNALVRASADVARSTAAFSSLVPDAPTSMCVSARTSAWQLTRRLRPVRITRSMICQLNARNNGAAFKPCMLNDLVRAIYDCDVKAFESSRVVHTIELHARHIVIVHAPPNKEEKRKVKKQREALSAHMRALVGLATTTTTSTSTTTTTSTTSTTTATTSATTTVLKSLAKTRHHRPKIEVCVCALCSCAECVRAQKAQRAQAAPLTVTDRALKDSATLFNKGSDTSSKHVLVVSRCRRACVLDSGVVTGSNGRRGRAGRRRRHRWRRVDREARHAALAADAVNDKRVDDVGGNGHRRDVEQEARAVRVGVVFRV